MLALAGLVVFSLIGYAGNLEPSGPPGPTMKTLQEVEPRTPISQSDVPKTILTPGSYYLTENLMPVDIDTPHVIEIGTHDVTLDLRGFTITGSNFETVSADDGIVVTQTNAKNIVIKNGAVRYCMNEGIDAIKAGNSQILNIRSYSNTFSGILLGSGLVWQCVTESNGNGISAGSGSTVMNCSARKNNFIGINTGDRCFITGNTSSENTSDGIGTGSDCTVTNNTASNNGAWGIESSDSVISGNTANGNTGDGIKVSSNCLVLNNNCSGNGPLAADAAGILAIGARNRIEGNNVVDNDRGIDVDVANNVIVKNSAGGNMTEYTIVAGNKVGATSTNPATAGPWDNFDY